MSRRKLTDVLVVFLGLGYVGLGVAETVRAVRSGDGGIPFWFGSLVGGGTLILLGQVMRRRPSLSATLIGVGCLAGTLATFWTLLVPVFAVVVFVLVLVRTDEDQRHAAQSNSGSSVLGPGPEAPPPESSGSKR